MSDASTTQRGSQSTADRAVLECVAACRASYPAVVAHRTGMRQSVARERCEALADAGLLEGVTGEVLYRLTPEGRAAVRETPE